MKAGTPVKIHPVPDLKVGINEFFIQVGTAETPAVPELDGEVDDPFAAAGFGDATEDAGDFNNTDQGNSLQQNEVVGVAKAVRVRIFDGDEVLVEKTVWSEPGRPSAAQWLSIYLKMTKCPRCRLTTIVITIINYQR